VKAETTKRSSTALKIHKGLEARLTRFCSEHAVVPKNTIYNKALAFYLDYAEHGVDFNLNPLHLEGKRR
jgi:hypothetical protein